MKKLIAGGLALSAIAGSAGAEEITLQLKWVTQAQFAGYYVAESKGFYDEAGLD
ncbi:ABC transporter substrate-binding protein, partial [Pseudooceanicola sp. HF7]|uniref:ABC transporter substrate-binding protein n=1 Tax=Pseudooceanicola sp. HF7 TaxID=2721560 RepID=UPI001432180A